MDGLRPRLIVSYSSLANALPTLKGGIKNGEDFGKLSCLDGWRALLGPGPRRQQGSCARSDRQRLRPVSVLLSLRNPLTLEQVRKGGLP